MAGINSTSSYYVSGSMWKKAYGSYAYQAKRQFIENQQSLTTTAASNLFGSSVTQAQGLVQLAAQAAATRIAKGG